MTSSVLPQKFGLPEHSDPAHAVEVPRDYVPTAVDAVAAEAKAAVRNLVSTVSGMDPHLIVQIETDFASVEMEAVRKNILPPDYLLKGYGMNRLLLLRMMMKDRFPQIVFDSAIAPELYSYLLKRCGLGSDQR